MADKKRKRYVLEVPEDSPIAKWMSLQPNNRKVLRLLVERAMHEFGDTDLISLLEQRSLDVLLNESHRNVPTDHSASSHLQNSDVPVINKPKTAPVEPVAPAEPVQKAPQNDKPKLPAGLSRLSTDD